MHRWTVRLALLAIVILAAVLISNPVNAQVDPFPHRPGEVIIKFKDSATDRVKSEILADLGATQIRRFGRIRARHSRITRMSVSDAVARYRSHPEVEFIEPNYLWSENLLPNDPDFVDLWGLLNTGQTGGTPGADISAIDAWESFTGSRDAVVAVIDSGVDYTHPDLAANMWRNPGEVADNDVDDDSNGFVDDVYGWDFINGDDSPLDDRGHGTHVAGTIGAVGNNGIGVVGVNWHVSLMALKFLGSDGYGSTTDAISCVEYATAMGAHVMNNSWGGGPYSEALRQAIDDARQAGILFVAAAGNAGANNDVSPHYPSSYDLPNVIAVAATDHNDQLAGFSSYGATSVDLAAPGVAIWSTRPGNQYGYSDGTSMAAPHVAGALALIRGRFPQIAWEEAKTLLLERVDPLSNLDGIVLTGGRLNAFLPVAEPDDTPPAAITDLEATDPNATRVTLVWTASGDDGVEGNARRYDVRYSTAPIDEVSFDSAQEVPLVPLPATAGTREELRVDGLAFATEYQFAIRVFDELGNASPISNVAVGITLGPPDLAAAPASFDASLLTGGVTTRVLTLQNTGEGEAIFSVSAVSPALNSAGFGGGGVESAAGGRPTGTLHEAAAVPAATTPYAPESRGAAAQTEEIGIHSVLSTELRLLIVESGAEVTNIQSHLEAFPDISEAAVFHAQDETPTFEYLLDFDALIVVVNSPLSDPTGIGDVLADYADTGRGLVMTLASVVAGWAPAGRLVSGGYLPFPLGSGPIGPSSLGTFDPTHPIMNGVGTAWGDLLASLDLAPGAELVASWSNGEPLVATQGLNVVGVNVYVAGTGYWSGDIPQLLHNAAFWSSRVVPWLTVEPFSGVVPGGESLDLVVSFNASGLDAGDYEADLLVESDDPDQPEITLTAALHVTAAPDIYLPDDALDFGPVFIGGSRQLELVVRNTGFETLDVTSLQIDSGVFAADLSAFVVEPGDFHVLTLTFQPSSEGPIQGMLALHSNDPDLPEAGIELHGVGLVPPDIDVVPASIDEDLFTGETSTRTVTIHNTGSSDLVWDLVLRQPLPAGSAAATESLQAEPAPWPAPRPVGLNLGEDEQPDIPPSVPLDSSAAQVETPFAFHDGFEDGDSDGWTSAGSGSKEVTSATAARGTFYSYHEYNSPSDHFNGVYRSLGDVRPGYISLHVRSASTSSHDCYFLVRDQYGAYLLYFYARASGFFRVGAGGDGDESFPYQPYTWYHVEFRDIDWEAKTFDYYVDGGLVRENMLFRESYVANADRLDLYNYTSGSQGWWDEIQISTQQGPPWLGAEPMSGIVPAGSSVDVELAFDAAGLYGGDYAAEVSVASNDPDEAEVVVPVTLHVTGAPDVALSVQTLDHGPVYIGASSELTFSVLNAGTDTLNVSEVSSDHSDFTVSPSAFSLAPTQSQVVTVTFEPSSPGLIAGTLTIVSDDPDEPAVSVALLGEGVTPPEIDVSPVAVEEDLFTGETSTRTLTIHNTGGSDLVWGLVVRNPPPATAQAHGELHGASPPTSQPGAIVATEDDGQLPEIPPRVALNSAAWQVQTPFLFHDGFEDGDSDGWISAGVGAKEVTSATAARGTIYSYHEFSSPSSHFNGVYRELGDVRPGYISFHVRSGSTTTHDSYFVVRDQYGADLVWFFAQGGGYFYVNNASPSYPYEAETWYHVEFKEIDWDTKTFDYYVDGGLIRENIPFRDSYVVNVFRLDLYNYSSGSQGWWDEIQVSTDENPPWLRAGTTAGVVPAGASADVDLDFDAAGLHGGDYAAEVVVSSNDLDEPELVVPVTMRVTGAPDIALSAEALDYGPVYIGLSPQQSLRVSNVGTDTLNVSDVSTDHADFTVSPSVFSLAPGQHQDVTVTFSPSSPGLIGGILTLLTDDPDEPEVTVALQGEGVVPPEIGVSPVAIEEEMITGEVLTRTLTIANTGGSDLDWTLELVGGGLASDLEGILDALNARYAEVTALIPNRFDFYDGISGYYINDGGNDMYDGGNYLGTDLGYYIYYSDNSVQASTYFGSGGRYFTRKYPGLFVLAADMQGVDYFRIAGSLGADGYGSADGTVLATTKHGVPYLGFVKRVHGAGDPSVNHLIIVEDGPGIDHEFETYTNDDYHRVFGLSGTHRIYYLLYAASGGGYIDDDATLAIMDAFLDAAVPLPPWLSASGHEGTVPAGAQTELQLTLDPQGLYGGDYTADILIDSNDIDEPQVTVPVTLHLTGIPDIGLSVSALDYGSLYIGLTSDQTFQVVNNGTDVLHVSEVLVDHGDFGANPAGFSLAPEESRDLVVTFSPSGAALIEGTLTVLSDDPDEPEALVALAGVGVIPPEIGVSPTALAEDLFTDESVQRTLTVSNTGGSDLDWILELVGAGFSSELEEVRDALNLRYAGVTALIPDRYDFSDGASGYYIYDGGSNMYDRGNYLATDLGYYIYYSDSSIQTDSRFGSGGRYFTRKYPGLFVLAADMQGVDDFRITGNLGANGYGTADGTTLATTRHGIPYRGFVKRVYGTSSPSVNHLIIVEDVPGIYQEFTVYTDDDFHRVFGLSGTHRIYYLLYASSAGGYIDDESTLAIMDAFLDAAVPLPPWLSGSEYEGVVPAGGVHELLLTFDATGMYGGDYAADAVIHSNDIDEPVVTVPVTLHVTGIPDIDLSTTEHDYGPLFIGLSSEWTLTVTNAGTDVLNVTSITSDRSDFSSDTASFALDYGESRDVVVSFAPGSAGPIAGRLILSSDDPDEAELTVELTGAGVVPPEIDVSPVAIAEDLFTGDVATHTMTISNSGGSDLDWTLAILEQGPNAGLESTLEALNAGYADITALIPNRWDFYDGVVGHFISDGGYDMYDGGNYLGTDLGYYIYYSDNSIQASNYFGSGGRYFTRKYPGLFVLAADMQGVDTFRITGNLGADGYGAADGTVLATTRYGVPYLGFVKRVYGTGDPSVNHLIIVREEPGIDHVFQTDTNDDYHQVFGLAGSRTIYYLLYAGFGGRYIDNDETLAIMEAFLESAVPVPPWLTSSAHEGTVPAGSADDLLLTFDASGMFGGDYSADVLISSNDIDEQELIVPVTLHVTGVPDIDLFPSSLAYGPLFIGLTAERTLTVSNVGTDVLHVSEVLTDHGDFVADATSFSVDYGESYDLGVTFAPGTAGPITGMLTLVTNDPDEGELTVALSGVGVVPPDIDVTPGSFTESLVLWETTTRTLAVENTGGSALSYQINFSATSILSGSAAGAEEAPFDDPDDPERPPADAPGSYSPVPVVDPFHFHEDFEDGNLDGWQSAVPTSNQEVTAATAADATAYSYHEAGSAGGSYDGIYRDFGPARPTYVSFWVRSASGATQDGAFVLKDAAGRDAIFFETGDDGQLWVNKHIPGGNTSVQYDALTWIHVEFRDIDFDARSFDYVVNGVLIQPDIPFQHGSDVREFGRVDLFNYLEGSEAWWDEVTISTTTPVNWVVPTPDRGLVAVGGTAEISAFFDTTGFDLSDVGTHQGQLIVTSNDPDEPVVSVPVTLTVRSEPNIRIQPAALDFGVVFIGVTGQHTIVVRNIGPEILSVTDINVDHPDYSVDPTAFDLGPGHTRTVTVSFAPSSEQTIAATLSIVSNDPDQSVESVALTGEGLVPPQVAVSPEAIDAEAFLGFPSTRTLTVGNAGGSPLHWDAAPFGAGSSPDLEQVLEILDQQYEAITNQIPFRWDFTDGVTGVSIYDGGRDMYDIGNFLNTDLGGPIPYSDGVVSETEFLGGHGRYFTRKYPGLFVFAADLLGVDEFIITGNLGADGRGLAEGSVLQTTVNGTEFGGFVKRVWNSPDPSVNHLIIVPSPLGVEQEFPANTNDDYHRVYNLGGRGRIYYLLYAGRYSNHIGDPIVLSMMNTFLEMLPTGPGWMHLEPNSGSVDAGQSTDVEITFNRNLFLELGEYEAGIAVQSNDPFNRLVTVPVTLNVVEPPDIALPVDELAFGTVFTGTDRVLSLVVVNEGLGELEILSVTSEHAEISAAPTAFVVPPESSATLDVTWSPLIVDALDATLSVESNDPDEPVVTVHLAGDAIPPPVANVAPLSLVAALPPHSDMLKTRTLHLSNTGGSDLIWTIEAPEYVAVAPSSGVTPADEAIDVVLTLSSAALDEGDYLPTVRIHSNDPFNNPLEVSLTFHVREVQLDYLDIDLTPRLEDPRSSVEATLQLPPPYNPRDVVISSVSFWQQLFCFPDPVLVEDRNTDSVPDLTLQFDSLAYEKFLPAGELVTATLTGEVQDQTWFTGTVTVRMMAPDLALPDGGEFLILGQPVTIDWREGMVTGRPDYAVFLSRDGGETWESLADGLEVTEWLWTVSGTVTAEARVRIYAWDDGEVLGYDSSEADFVIQDGGRAPGPVSSLDVVSDGASAVLTWKPPAVDLDHGPAESYRVLRSTAGPGAFTPIGTTAAEAYDDPLDATSNATLVFYTIVAVNGTGQGEE